MASVHCAAATENLIALVQHFTDIPFWNDFIDGVPKPLIQNGYIQVLEAPGLGFEINADARKEHLVPDDLGFCEPTPQWDIAQLGSPLVVIACSSATVPRPSDSCRGGSCRSS